MMNSLLHVDVGVGWISEFTSPFCNKISGSRFKVYRDKAHLPKDMVFELHYLGSASSPFFLLLFFN